MSELETNDNETTKEIAGPAVLASAEEISSPAASSDYVREEGTLGKMMAELDRDDGGGDVPSKKEGTQMGRAELEPVVNSAVEASGETLLEREEQAEKILFKQEDVIAGLPTKEEQDDTEETLIGDSSRVNNTVDHELDAPSAFDNNSIIDIQDMPNMPTLTRTDQCIARRLLERFLRTGKT